MSDTPQTSRPIHQLFESAEQLRDVLLDLNVRYVRVTANGYWSYEKLGRARHGDSPIATTLLHEIAEMIGLGRHLRSGEWAIRKVDGVSGPSLLIERLPIAVAERLPQTILTTLKQQVKGDGNGVLVGQPGSGKSGLLLWLALQIPEQPVLYIAENPPSEFPGTHVMHVFPPANAAERRAIERFARLAPVVMWERITRSEELQTLFGFAGATRRWFTSDAVEVPGVLTLLKAANRDGFQVELDTVLHLASSVIGRPEARSLVVRSNDTWSEVWSGGASILHLFETTPPPPPRARAVPYADSPHTVEVDDADLERYDRQDDAVTGMIPGDAIKQLREQGMLNEPAQTHAEPAPDAHVEPNVAEATRAYVEPPAELVQDLRDLTKPSRYFDEAPDAVANVAQVPLEDLRITTMEELQPEDLNGLQAELGDLDSDYSEVLKEEIDFDFIASEMLSEISDIEPLLDEAAMATDPNQAVLGMRVYDADDLSDSTKEFTLEDRLEMLRKRKPE